MKGSRKAAFQAEELAKLRDENRELQSELKALELELKHKEKVIAEKDKAFQALKDKFEEYLSGYSEKVKALEDAELEYKTAAMDARKMQKAYREEFEKEIAAVRSFNRKGA